MDAGGVMSEQSRSNFQAAGAGLLGFIAAMAIGGGALFLRSSPRARPAASSIDLGSSMPIPAMSSALVQTERRAQSPSPLIGAEDESDKSQAPAGAVDAPTGGAVPSEAAPSAQASSPRLETIRHLDAQGGGSSATTVVKNSAAPEMAAEPAGKKVAPRLKLTGRGSAAIAAVRYGGTSRDGLMGRASGPVYNFKGAGKGASAATARMADGVSSQVAGIQGQLESSDLPGDQRAKFQKDLAEANKRVTDTGDNQ